MTQLHAAQRLYRHIRYQIRRSTLPLRQSGFSSLNEESLIRKYFDELLPRDVPRFAVDIGAGDGRVSSNTLAFFIEGWRGLGVEFDARKFSKLARLYQKMPDVYACRLLVTPQNVLPLLEAYHVKEHFGLLSLDIDSYDYWVLDAILSRYRPALVVAEINEKIPPPIKFCVKFKEDFRPLQHFFGFSIACLEELCAEHRYTIIELEYNNVFLMPMEFAGAHALSPVEAYRRGYLERADRHEKFPRNENMEALHTLTPAEQEQFIRKFFAGREDDYEMGSD